MVEGTRGSDPVISHINPHLRWTNGWLREGKGGGGDRGSDPVISHINSHLRWDESRTGGGRDQSIVSAISLVTDQGTT